MNDIEYVTKLPPHSIPSEQGLLGCFILSAVTTIDDPLIGGRIPSDEIFYDLRHRGIYNAIVQMRAAGAPIDLITLCEHLTKQGLLDTIGGAAYLSSLVDLVPSAANASYYLETIRDKYARRQIIKVAQDAIDDAYAEQKQPLSVASELEAAAGAIAVADHKRSKTIAELVSERLAYYDKVLAGDTPSGLKIGLTGIDDLTGGFQHGLTIVASRPGNGKTALITTAINFLCLQGVPCGLVSREMTAESMVDRHIGNLARVDTTQVASFNERDLERICKIAAKLRNFPFYLDDDRSAGLPETLAMIRHWHMTYKVRFVVVDLLTRQKVYTEHTDRDRVNAVLVGLRDLALALGIVIVGVVHLNRGADGERARLKHLRETGRIEEDSDYILFLEPVSEDDEDDSPCIPVDARMVKSRFGKKGVAELRFLREYGLFEDIPFDQQRLAR